MCKELARFLAALDESGEILRDAMSQVDLPGTRRDVGERKSSSSLRLPHLDGVDNIVGRISSSSPTSDETSASDTGSID